MATKKRKSILILFTQDNWKKEWPKETAGAKHAKHIWSQILDKRGYDLLNGAIGWFDKDHFTKYRRHKITKPVMEDIVESVVPEVVYDQSRNYHLDTHLWRQDLWEQKMRIRNYSLMVNLPEFNSLLDNKSNQAVIFNKFMPKTRIWEPGSTILNPEKKHIVLKKIYGSGGREVRISQAPRIKVNSLMIQQEFIEATRDGDLRDLRIGFINHEPMYAYYRIAKKGNLFTNVHMGARMEFEKLSRIKKLLAHSQEVAKPLKIFPYSVYSLDYLIDAKSRKPYLIEANTMPGFNHFPDEILELYFTKLTDHLIGKNS